LVIEIRADQILEQRQEAIFQASHPRDDHRYEFPFGRRPFDPDGPNHGGPSPQPRKNGDGDARTTKWDDLNLKPGRVFDYGFDVGEDGYHRVRVDRIEKAIPTVNNPHVITRVG
jgi:hypothetical protein